MEELIKEVSDKAGVTPEQAKKAITVVADSLKSKMPHVFHSQIDNLINGGTLSDSAKKKFEELKTDLEDAAKNIGTKAEEFAKEMKSKVDELFKK
jgi:polyhydroxyalkanoate synthesis regulator phasin